MAVAKKSSAKKVAKKAPAKKAAKKAANLFIIKSRLGGIL